MRWYERVSIPPDDEIQGSFSATDELILDLSEQAGEEGGPGPSLRTLSALLESAGVRRALEIVSGVTFDRKANEATSVGKPSAIRLVLAAVYAFNLMPERALQILDHLSRVENPGTRAALLGLRGFCFALLGNVAEANANCAASEGLIDDQEPQNTVGRSSALAPALAARALLAFEVGDEARLNKAVQEMLSLRMRSEMGRSGARALAILPKILSRDTTALDDRILTLDAGDNWSPPGSRFGSYLKWAQSLDFVIKGLPGLAISASQDAYEFSDHLVCLDSSRALAWLALGQEQLARLQLGDCLRLKGEHNLRTINGARSLAALTLRKRDRRRAEQLLRTIEGLGGPENTVLFALVPSPLVADARKQLGIGRDRGRARQFEAIDAVYARMSGLSEREFLVLCHLNLRDSLDDLASTLSVSKNTIRSQVQSIYHKLNVDSRREAADLARSIGLDARVASSAMRLRQHRPS